MTVKKELRFDSRCVPSRSLRAKEKGFTVSQAVSTHLSCHNKYSEDSPTIAAQIDSISNFLGELTDMLHKSGNLTDQQIQGLLQESFKLKKTS